MPAMVRKPHPPPSMFQPLRGLQCVAAFAEQAGSAPSQSDTGFGAVVATLSAQAEAASAPASAPKGSSPGTRGVMIDLTATGTVPSGAPNTREGSGGLAGRPPPRLAAILDHTDDTAARQRHRDVLALERVGDYLVEGRGSSKLGSSTLVVEGRGSNKLGASALKGVALISLELTPS